MKIKLKSFPVGFYEEETGGVPLYQFEGYFNLIEINDEILQLDAAERIAHNILEKVRTGRKRKCAAEVEMQKVIDKRARERAAKQKPPANT